MGYNSGISRGVSSSQMTRSPGAETSERGDQLLRSLVVGFLDYSSVVTQGVRLEILNEVCPEDFFSSQTILKRDTRPETPLAQREAAN